MDTEVIKILSSDTDSVKVFDTGSPPAHIPESCGAVGGEVLPGPSGESIQYTPTKRQSSPFWPESRGVSIGRIYFGNFFPDCQMSRLKTPTNFPAIWYLVVPSELKTLSPSYRT